MAGEFGRSRFGFDPYGGMPDPFTVIGAVALNQVTVRVEYNELCSLSNPNLTDISKYVLTPATAVHHVRVETGGSVVLSTEPLTSAVYTLTVSDIFSWADRVLDPNPAVATFNGYISEGFVAVPVSDIKVRLLFSATSMLVNAALTAISSYAVSYLNGGSFPIVKVEVEGPPSSPVAVALTLGTVMPADVVLLATVCSPDVLTVDGYPITNSICDFRWIPKPWKVHVPFQNLSKPGTTPRLDGQVFFSPAYKVPAPRSAIQVTEVAVCTRAYDVYKVPDEPYAPKVLATFKAGVTANALCVGVPFASFPKLTGASTNVYDYRLDSVSEAIDSRCIATLTETLDPTRVARLNGVRWPLFTPSTPTPFICAANLTPIGPGTTEVRTLES